MTVSKGDHLFIGRQLKSTEIKGNEGHVEYEVLQVVSYSDPVIVHLKPVR